MTTHILLFLILFSKQAFLIALKYEALTLLLEHLSTNRTVVIWFDRDKGTMWSGDLGKDRSAGQILKVRLHCIAHTTATRLTCINIVLSSTNWKSV